MLNASDYIDIMSKWTINCTVSNVPLHSLVRRQTLGEGGLSSALPNVHTNTVPATKTLTGEAGLG